MSFLRFLGGRPAAATPTPNTAEAETAAVRRIVARLEALPPDQARLLAGIAYILARAAYADLDISEDETAVMESELAAFGLDAAQAALVAEMAKLQERTTGATSDFLVTREFKEHATVEQRLSLLRACFRVCLADEQISGSESSVLAEIASELGLDRTQSRPIRAEFAEKFSARFDFIAKNEPKV
jgi:uncharacterized tellurite resistance protein B-like protein